MRSARRGNEGHLSLCILYSAYLVIGHIFFDDHLEVLLYMVYGIWYMVYGMCYMLYVVCYVGYVLYDI